MTAINIFISSSFHNSFTLGFNGERDALKTELAKDKELNDISLDYGDPQHKGSIEISLDRVVESNLVILFIGSRYGGIVDGKDISLTHLEYRKAIELGKSLLVYIFPRDIKYPDYDRISGFIKEIEKDNKTIYTFTEELFVRFNHDVLTCKAGAIEDSDKLIEKKNLFYDTLALKIVNDISKIKNELQFKLPAGIKPLEDDTNVNREYKKNLLNENLPYIKRSEFKKLEECSNAFQTEMDIYNKLFDDRYNGVLISGKGGIGKTRLMLELGRIASRDGWEVYNIFEEFKDWGTFKLDESKKYCFLFDYVEESKIFKENILDELNRIYPDIKIKLIANSRANYAIEHNIEASFPGIYEFKFEDNADEILYMQYVIKNIFKNINIEKFSDKFIQSINRPSFAVFLLNSKYEDIDDFHSFHEFGQFIAKRLELDFSTKFADINKEVFRLLASLPFTQDNITNEKKESILYVLEDAGWIEEDCEDGLFYPVYNDTILDEVFILHLSKFRNDRRLKEELIQIFDYADQYSLFKNAFNRLNKIKEKSILDKKVNIFKDIFELKIEKINEIQDIFAKSSFLPKYDILKFMTEHKILDLKSNIFTTLLLSTMKNVDKENIDKISFVNEQFQVWISYVENMKYFEDLSIGSFLIPSYYSFYGNNVDKNDIDINSITFKWIEKYGGHYFSDHVMRAYLLDDKTKGKEIQQYVKKWLQINVKKSINSSFLLEAYLLKKDTEYIDLEEYVKIFLSQKEYVKNYSYILDPYLGKYGSLESIKPFVKKWLSKNKMHKSYSFILQKYLEQSSEKAGIRWINDNTKDKQSFSYIIKMYFNRGGYLKPIESSVQIWLNDNKEEIEVFGNVVKVYFENGGLLKPIESSVQIWLNDNKEEEKLFPSVVQAYFRKGGDYEPIEDSVAFWLNKYSNYTDIFSGVVRGYFSNNGSLLPLESIIINWINKNNNEQLSFSYVVDSYLKNNGNISPVYTSIQSWLDKNKGSMERNFLLKTAVKSALKVDIHLHCIDKYFSMLFRVNANKKIRNKIYKDIAHCLSKTDFYLYPDKFTYLYIAGQYLKVEDISCELEKKLMEYFSDYIRNIDIESLTESDIEVITIYMSREYIDNQNKIKIINLYENYLNIKTKKNDDMYYLVLKKYLTLADIKEEVLTSITKYFENYLMNIDIINYKDKNKYYDICKMYLSIEKINREIAYKINILLNKLTFIEDKYLKRHLNILFLLAKNKIFIDLDSSERILSLDSFYLKSYFLNPDAKDEVIKKYFRIHLNGKVSKSTIDVKFRTIINAYFSRFELYSEDKNLIINFIRQNIQYMNSGKIIIDYLLYGNDFKDINESIKLFLQVDGHTEYLKNEFINHKEDNNYDLLKDLEVILLNY